jgi:S1-C subfamily serine protease
VNIIDIVIILFFITALARGVELGAIRQGFSTIGLFIGLFLGAFVQGKLIHFAHTPPAKAMLAVVTIVVFIGIFSTLSEYIGVMIRQRIERARRLHIIDTADRAIGSVIAGAAVLVFVWLGASIFNNVPLQGLQRQIQGSVVIAQLNKSLPAAPDVVSRLGHLIDPNSFPDVFTGLEPRVDTNAKLPSIGELDPAVQSARLSVVKVQGSGCGGVSTGSGFVADENLVITNAHVVAGVKEPGVVDGKGRHKATVIWFDENLDVAVLRTSDLAGEPLQINTDIAADGTPGAVLGYPGGGEFTASPASVLDSFKAVGRNIYNQGNTEREVYSVKAAIVPGNSGGPIINKDGTVIGLVFAESTSYKDVGYALTMSDVLAEFNQAKDRSQAVATGSCAQ